MLRAHRKRAKSRRWRVPARTLEVSRWLRIFYGRFDKEYTASYTRGAKSYRLRRRGIDGRHGVPSGRPCALAKPTSSTKGKVKDEAKTRKNITEFRSNVMETAEPTAAPMGTEGCAKARSYRATDAPAKAALLYGWMQKHTSAPLYAK